MAIASIDTVCVVARGLQPAFSMPAGFPLRAHATRGNSPDRQQFLRQLREQAEQPTRRILAHAGRLIHDQRPVDLHHDRRHPPLLAVMRQRYDTAGERRVFADAPAPGREEAERGIRQLRRGVETVRADADVRALRRLIRLIR